MTTFPIGSSLARSNRFGFTLVELILVSVVLTILLAVSIPRFAQTARRMSIERAAFELTHMLRYTHGLAISQGNEVVWVFDHNARSVHLFARITPADKEESDTWANADNVPRRRFDEAISVSRLADDSNPPIGCPLDVSGDGECVHFFPDGTAEAAILAMNVDGNITYTITVNGTTGSVVLSAGSPLN